MKKKTLTKKENPDKMEKIKKRKKTNNTFMMIFCTATAWLVFEECSQF